MRTIAAPPLPAWIQREMPFARAAMRISGDLVSYVDHGPRDGRPVLLVHGNPTWSYLWRKVLTELDDGRFRLVAPDLVGFGASEKPRRASDHQLAMHIERVGVLIEELGLEQIIAVGQDWGGPIAAGAAKRTGRAAGLVFGNTGVLPPARPFRSKPFHRFSHLPLVSDVVFRGTLFPVPVMRMAQGDPASLDVRTLAAYAWPFLRPLHRAGPLGLARMVPNSEHHPSTSVMDEVGAWVMDWHGPAALVWGRRDPILGRGLSRHRRALPQARVFESDAGHFLQEEVPELFARAIREVADAIDGSAL